ncbi:dickkopf-related protein 3a [Scleropages formosus]|uniref:Dickkopf WNT signaling pathway inhibitor 3a n=1 Tax=Scleropages formosus TaxID=113540 RepID=A0A8C9S130_SCLFO|nr:dickkopf-related protein 3 [Scleropages formosus]
MLARRVMSMRRRCSSSPFGVSVLLIGLLHMDHLHRVRAHVQDASPPADSGPNPSSMGASLTPGHATLNDMFREVEKLMEDTQHKLEEAVYKMDNESAKSMLYPYDLPPRSQEERSPEEKGGDESGRTAETIDEAMNNNTVATHFSSILVQPDGRGNEIDRECLIDEDCPPGNYCLYEVLQSRCLPCKALHTTCTKDEECCSGQLCLWGQCSDNGTKGEAGSICQYQSDCSPELCCAFHRALLFPVCTGRPTEHERCHGPSNHLMELLSWDMDGEGPREYCPCGRGLQCQPQGRGSLCLRPQNSSSEEVSDSLYSEADYIV